MAYSEELASRIRDLLGARSGVSERRMFGSLAFLLNGHLACGARGEDLLMRVDQDESDALIRAEPHVFRPDMGGRKMRTFLQVDAVGLTTDAELARWVDLAADVASTLPPK